MIQFPCLFYFYFFLIVPTKHHTYSAMIHPQAPAVDAGDHTLIRMMVAAHRLSAASPNTALSRQRREGESELRHRPDAERARLLLERHKERMGLASRTYNPVSPVAAAAARHVPLTSDPMFNVTQPEIRKGVCLSM